jgi:hypothetical protein
MANYECVVRTNYFRVKDMEAFKKEIERMAYLEVGHSITDEELVMFYRDDGDPLPGWYETDENGDYYERDAPEIDWADFFKRHLEDEEVAIIMEAGHEKLRYVSGYAMAYNNKGEEEFVSLNHIYEKAMWLGKNITDAEY